MKKVLMIAQYFPPAGGVGVIRVTKFVKYLREFGWEPIVLTVRQDCYPEKVWLDQSLLKDIPEDVAIYRTGIWRTGAINDEGIRWLPYLLFSMNKIIRKESPHLIYLTGGPFFPLLAGPFAKFLFKLPYVVDLRDPWKLARRSLPLRGLKAAVGSLLTNVAEPFVLRYAERIICVSEHMCWEYQQVYRDLASKFVVITNGYDPDDVSNITPHIFNNFTVVYAGKFRTAEAFRNPRPFFQALRILRDRGYDIEFIHVGNVEEEVVKIAKEVGISEAIKFIGPRPHNEALSYAKGANVLLLIGGGQKTEQTGKIFDYVVCARPILALAPSNGEIAKVAEDIPFARVVPNTDPEVIAKTLEEILQSPNNRCTFLPEKYHRRFLARKLAKIFDEVCQ